MAFALRAKAYQIEKSNLQAHGVRIPSRLYKKAVGMSKAGRLRLLQKRFGVPG